MPKDNFVTGMFVGLIIGAIMIALIAKDISDDYYKKGQIDAINGNIKYELVIIQSDGSTEWGKREE